MKRRLRQFLYTFYRAGEKASRGLRRRVTEAGWLMLGIAFVMGLSGLDTTWSMHYQIFSLVVGVIAVAVGCLLCMRRPKLMIERSCARFATAGVDLRYTLSVRNEGRRTCWSVRLREWLPDQLPKKDEFVQRPEPREEERNLFDRTFVYYRWMWLVDISRIARAFDTASLTLRPGESKQLTARLRPLRRGVAKLSQVRAVATEPFGLFRRAFRLSCPPHSMLVLPQRYPVPTLQLKGARPRESAGAGVTLAGVGHSEDFIGLREYRAGDPLRHLHWRSWARLGRPVVKEFEDEILPHYALVLDTALPPGADQELFEEAVSVAASFVATVETRESMLDLLFVADRAYQFRMAGPGASRAADKLLEVLAMVDVSTNPSVIDSLRASVLRMANDLNAAILVFLEWDASRQELARQLEARGVECLTLVITAGQEGGSANVYYLRLGEIGQGLARLQGASAPAPVSARPS